MGSSPIRVASRYASVAQLVEQGTENPCVVGSIPTGGTISADLAHLVERHLAKVEVAGSSPVIRSSKVYCENGTLFSFPLGVDQGRPPARVRVLSSRIVVLCRGAPLRELLALLTSFVKNS